MIPVVFCGMSGFSDFYKLRWLQAILSWQKPREGCYGEPGELHFLPDWEQGLGRGGAGLLGQVGKGCSGVRNVERDVHHACPRTHVHTDTHRCWGCGSRQVLAETSGSASSIRRLVLLEAL